MLAPKRLYKIHHHTCHQRVEKSPAYHAYRNRNALDINLSELLDLCSLENIPAQNVRAKNIRSKR